MIELRGVVKTYKLGDTPVPALRGVDLSIRKGDFTALSGPSGSGKTSVLNLIGLVDRPTAGEVLFEEQRVDGLSDDRLAELRNRSIGYVFQSFNLVAVFDALENVMLPLQIGASAGREARARAERCLEQVGVGHLKHTRPDKMSGGERQRVAIARALVTRPALILADEPTANLDTRTSLDILDLMRGLNQSEQVTFLFSTHDDRLLARVTRHVRMQDGRILEAA
jgi:putative ABC transport system ATP-binding protein